MIAVISPYAAQVSLLSSTLAAAAAGSVDVATLDSHISLYLPISPHVPPCIFLYLPMYLVVSPGISLYLPVSPRWRWRRSTPSRDARPTPWCSPSPHPDPILDPSPSPDPDPILTLSQALSLTLASSP